MNKLQIERYKHVKKIVSDLKKQLLPILKNHLIDIKFYPQINYQSGISIVLGKNYYNTEWFQYNKDKLEQIIYNFNHNYTDMKFSFKELSNYKYSINENIIKEDPDELFVDRQINAWNTDAVPFGIYNKQMLLGVPGKRNIHPDIADNYPEYDFPITFGREDFYFPGRLWTSEEIISFWKYPRNNSDLKGVIKLINNEAKNKKYRFKINDNWNIELADGNLVKVKDYINSTVRPKSELEKQHVVSPLKKKKVQVPASVGSKKKKSLKQRYQTENKEIMELTEKQKQIVYNLLAKYPDKEIPDSIIHKLSNVFEIETSELESFIYGLASNYVIDNNLNKKGKTTETLSLTSIVNNIVKEGTYCSGRIYPTDNKVPGGKGDNTSADDYDKREYIVGCFVEMEHTNDNEIASEIAKDHLSEVPEGQKYSTYYSDLIKTGMIDEPAALKAYKEQFNDDPEKYRHAYLKSKQNK